MKKKKKIKKKNFLWQLKIRLDQIFRRIFQEQWMFRAAYKGDYSQLGYLLWYILWKFNQGRGHWPLLMMHNFRVRKVGIIIRGFPLSVLNIFKSKIHSSKGFPQFNPQFSQSFWNNPRKSPKNASNLQFGRKEKISC